MYFHFEIVFNNTSWSSVVPKFNLTNTWLSEQTRLCSKTFKLNLLITSYEKVYSNKHHTYKFSQQKEMKSTIVIPPWAPAARMKPNTTRIDHVHSEDIEHKLRITQTLTRASVDKHSPAFKRRQSLLLPYWQIQLTLEKYTMLQINKVMDCIHLLYCNTTAFVASPEYRVNWNRRTICFYEILGGTVNIIAVHLPLPMGQKCSVWSFVMLLGLNVAVGPWSASPPEQLRARVPVWFTSSDD